MSISTAQSAATKPSDSCESRAEPVAPIKVAALYCRLSPRPDGKYEGVDLQEGWGRDYAASAWPDLPVEVFKDEGISAANGDRRDEYERLREWIANGRIAQVWAVEQTRLERREVEWFRLAAELDAAGITEVHTNRDGIVRVRDEVAGIKAVLAAGEVRKLTRRVNDRLAEIAASGQPPGVKPFGYVHAKKEVDGKQVRTYAVVPEQAEAIRWAADKVLGGWSLSHIAEELDRRGLRGVHGGKLAPGSVRRWLTGPSIAGLRVHSGRIVGQGNWEPILSETTWEQVNARLAADRVVRRKDGGTYPIGERHKGNPAGRKYLLTGGLAACGVCDKPLVGSVKVMKNGRRHPYLLCHPNRGGKGCVGIMLPETEAHVVSEMFTKLDQPEYLDAIAEDAHEARRDEIVQALGNIKTKRKTLAAQWARDDLTDAEWAAARDGLTEQEDGLRTELAAIPAPDAGVGIEEARDSWGDMTLDEQRQFVRRFVAKVTISRAKPGTKGFDPDRISLEFRKP